MDISWEAVTGITGQEEEEYGRSTKREQRDYRFRFVAINSQNLLHIDHKFSIATQPDYHDI